MLSLNIKHTLGVNSDVQNNPQSSDLMFAGLHVEFLIVFYVKGTSHGFLTAVYYPASLSVLKVFDVPLFSPFSMWNQTSKANTVLGQPVNVSPGKILLQSTSN